MPFYLFPLICVFQNGAKIQDGVFKKIIFQEGLVNPFINDSSRPAPVCALFEILDSERRLSENQ
jgi:hypothetical protein